jgi:hypothetical protein
MITYSNNQSVLSYDVLKKIDQKLDYPITLNK